MKKELMNTIVILALSTFLQAAALGQSQKFVEGDESLPEEISESILDLKIEDLCVQYRNPIDSLGNPKGVFQRSAQLEETRKAAATDYTASFTDFLVHTTEVLNLRLRFQKLAAEVFRIKDKEDARKLRSTEIPRVLVIDQGLYCERMAADRVRLEGGKLAETIQQEMKKALLENCMQESFGRANPFGNDIILSRQVAFHRNPLAADFALYHELCHVQYPGIKNHYLEEIFCDAMASKWILERPSKTQTKPLNQDLAIAVRQILKPQNPYVDILVLRSQLPGLCL